MMGTDLIARRTEPGEKALSERMKLGSRVHRTRAAVSNTDP